MDVRYKESNIPTRPFPVMAQKTVRFYPAGKEIKVEEGTRIAQAAKAAGVEIKLPCGGKGKCGRCGVYVSLTAEDGREPNPNGMERKLACITPVEENIDIFVPFDEDGRIVAGEDRRKAYDGELVPVVKARGKVQLGLAVDLGTAAIAVSILDLKKGLELYSTVGNNPQSFAGDDLESRRAYADSVGEEKLRKAAIDRINDLMYIFVNDPEDIKVAVISGKPYLMESLTEVCSMTGGPFCKGGKELGLEIGAQAEILCVKDLSAEVGGDLIGGIIGAGMDRSEENILLIDLGSTVQLALGNKDKISVCAADSGPALEGGNVIFGMTPSIGAIDSVMFRRGRLNYTVIGGIPPVGICGSGLIDLTAQMYSHGLIDSEGKFTKKTKPFESEDGPAYSVAEGIYVTESDISAVLKAKAAVSVSVRALMEHAGVAPEDVKKIVISGSFGNFVNTDNAVALGMFPDVDRDKFDYLGNASMTYAKNIILSEDVRNRADAVPGIVDVVNTRTEKYAGDMIAARKISEKKKPRRKLFG